MAQKPLARIAGWLLAWWVIGARFTSLNTLLTKWSDGRKIAITNGVHPEFLSLEAALTPVMQELEKAKERIRKKFYSGLLFGALFTTVLLAIGGPLAQSALKGTPTVVDLHFTLVHVPVSSSEVLAVTVAVLAFVSAVTIAQQATTVSPNDSALLRGQRAAWSTAIADAAVLSAIFSLVIALAALRSTKLSDQWPTEAMTLGIAVLNIYVSATLYEWADTAVVRATKYGQAQSRRSETRRNLERYKLSKESRASIARAICTGLVFPVISTAAYSITGSYNRQQPGLTGRLPTVILFW